MKYSFLVLECMAKPHPLFLSQPLLLFISGQIPSPSEPCRSVESHFQILFVAFSSHFNADPFCQSDTGYTVT